MVETKTYNILDSYVNPGSFALNLLDNGIVVIEFEEDFYELSLEHLMDLEEGLKYLGKGKKMRFFFNAKDFLSVNKEAIKYSTSKESGKYPLANAVLLDNSAKKLMYNILLKFKKPHVQTKGFRTKEDAFKWLLSLEDQ